MIVMSHGKERSRRFRQRMQRIALLSLLMLACNETHVDRNISPAVQDDLTEMRRAIGTFHSEQHRYPASLSELKQKHYLRDIPIDPATGSRNWRVTTEETVSNDDFSGKTTTGNTTVVVDVHSSAPGKDVLRVLIPGHEPSPSPFIRHADTIRPFACRTSTRSKTSRGAVIAFSST
jgi:general secretion pathway protein G